MLLLSLFVSNERSQPDANANSFFVCHGWCRGCQGMAKLNTFGWSWLKLVGGWLEAGWRLQAGNVRRRSFSDFLDLFAFLLACLFRPDWKTNKQCNSRMTSLDLSRSKNPETAILLGCVSILFDPFCMFYHVLLFHVQPKRLQPVASRHIKAGGEAARSMEDLRLTTKPRYTTPLLGTPQSCSSRLTKLRESR